MSILTTAAPLIPIAVAGVAGVTIFAKGYVKASTDEAIIISGLKKEPRVITGRSAIMIPFLERRDKLPLAIMKIDVKTQESVPTQEFINVNVDSVVTVKISSDPELIELASQNFLNRDFNYIVEIVREVLEGNIREIVGSMTLEGMISNRQLFSDKVKENAVPDMAKMGLEIVSFNVQNFTDRNNIIEDLGIDNTTKIKKNAAIVKAHSERDIAISRAQSDKEANDAMVKSKQEIAEKQNELAIREAELKQEADKKLASADSSYEIEQERQRKTIEETRAEANLAKQIKEIELKSKEVEIEEKRLEALIKKKAEAERYEREQNSEAALYERQKEAEAGRYEIEQQSIAVKSKSLADKEAKENEARGVEAMLKAEAEGIKAKGLAEAEGIEKKALAMERMKEAAVLEMYFNALPEIAENIAKPLSNVDSITMYGEGNSAKMIGDITKSTTQVMSGLTDAMGFDVKSMISGFLGGKVASNKSKEESQDASSLEDINAVLNQLKETTEGDNYE